MSDCGDAAPYFSDKQSAPGFADLPWALQLVGNDGDVQSSVLSQAKWGIFAPVTPLGAQRWVRAESGLCSGDPLQPVRSSAGAKTVARCVMAMVII